MGQQTPSATNIHERLSKFKSERERRIIDYLKRTNARQRFSSEILLIDVTKNGIPVYRAPLNANAGITAGIDKLHSAQVGLSLQGEGMTIGIWDAGKVVDHIELGNRIVQREDSANANNHAEHVAGTLFAAGINPAAKGMAPMAEGKSWFYDNDYNEMYAAADEDGLIISNHSYGSLTGWFRYLGVWYWTGDTTISSKEDYRFGFYGEETSIIDQIANLKPYYTIVWAAGNDRWEVGSGEVPPDGNEGTGYDCIIPEAVAKNSIVVGACDKVLNYTGPASVANAFFSSWGPTDDGRIKPDLVGDGVNVFSLSSTPADGYHVDSGTSMSTPTVTGTFTLLQQLYKRMHGDKIMRSSTLKALAIHTAKETGDDPGPDYRFGWGLIDAEQAAKTILNEDGVNVMIQELDLVNGQTITIPLQPVPDKKITVTIAWNDPYATPVAATLDPTTPMLVNDIDVKLADLEGNEIFPWILDPASPATAATTGDNFRDNVEKIEFLLPEDKPYNVVISHKGNLFGPQTFSLIITHESKLTTGKTFFWIGGTGTWNDDTHWSLSTGGATAGQLPTISDRVIIDDNSFAVGQQDTLKMDTTRQCNALLWLTKKNAVMSMNGYRLTLDHGMTIASDSFTTVTPGAFVFDGGGELFIQTGNIENDTLLFSGGDWAVHGPLTAASVKMLEGTLNVSNNTIDVSQLVANEFSTMDITNSTIDSAELIVFDKTTLQSAGTVVKISKDAVFNFDNIQFDGKLEIDTLIDLQLHGDSEIDSLLVNGIVHVFGSNRISYLTAQPGSELYFAGNKTQFLTDVELLGLDTIPIVIHSIDLSNALLDFNDHKKICFDYLEIGDVNITGNAVVNAGEHSTVSDGLGWLTVPCDQVLLPQFTFEFTCSHGLSQFTDESTGDVTTWAWNFGDPGSAQNTATGDVAYHQFSGPGTYTVTLTISNAVQQQEYFKQVEILPNTLDDNMILSNGHILASLKTAPAYQWYRDGMPIEGATNKTYPADDDGSYTLLTSDSDCNYLTDPFIVLGDEELALRPYRVYPVPADKRIEIVFKEEKRSHHVVIHNAMGQRMIQFDSKQNETSIDASKLRDGMYILDADGYKSKVIVRH